MNFKIWHKLAFLLIATTTLTLVVGIGLSQRSFKSGFMDYIQRQEDRRLESLSDNLIMVYEENGNWESLRGNKQLWFFFLRPRPGKFGPVEEKHVRGGPPGDFHPRHERGRRGPIPYFGGGRRLPRLALLDQNKNLIVGKRNKSNDSRLYPLELDDEIVGFIESERPKGITDRLDRMFEKQQNNAFVINTIVAIVLSIVVALLASFYFRKRINELNQIAQHLTSGRYEQRVDIKQKDELGQLGNDFNALAATLQKNQKAQQQWIADISHELRTPVAIVKGELEALDDGIRPLDHKAIQSLQQEILRLSQLIEDLYQLSISDMGALKYHKSEFNLVTLLDELEDSFMHRFNKNQLHFSLQVDKAKPLLFYGDQQRLFQLFSNLLENSLRYTDGGGKVELDCRIHNEDIVIKLSDSAPGIPEAQLQHIFERLFRLDSSRNRTHGGAGLGLAIVKQIVLAHHGEITAEASKLGGVSMICRFPHVK